jgi:peptide deformylase
MAIRKLIEAGNPILKSKNLKIVDFKSPKTKKLVKDLKDTMYETGLVGIAAPQIGQNFMAFVTHPRNTKSRKLPKTDKLRVYLNPKIIYESEKKTVIYEGCGSLLSELFGPVSRAKEVEVEALDEKGNKFRLKCDGLLARVILHEMDHLRGIEFIEKVSDYRKVITGTCYRKTIRNSKEQKENSKITKIEVTEL